MIRSPLKKSPKPGALKWALADGALPAVPHTQTTPISHALSSFHQVLNFERNSSFKFYVVKFPSRTRVNTQFQTRTHNQSNEVYDNKVLDRPCPLG